MYRWCVILMVLVALIDGAPVRAQDGANGHLSDEQRALIDRVVQMNFEGYHSYHTESSGSEKQAVTLSLGSASRTFVQTVTWSQSVDLVKVDGEKNIQAKVSATVSMPDTAEYTVNAEARLVDGVLYVKAAFAPPAPEEITLPDGWVIVEDAAHQDVYQYLQLDDLINGRSSLYDDAARLETLVSDVTLEARTLEDDTPVEAITLFFDRDGVLQSLRAIPNEETGTALADMMYDAVDSNSYAKTVLVVGPDNTPMQFEAATVVETAAIDARALDSSHYPEGTQLQFVLESSTSRTFSRIDEPLEPVSVPE